MQKRQLKKRSKRPFNLKTYLISVLRKASYRYPAAYEELKKSKAGPGDQYRCANCKGIFKRKETHRDHIVPIVDPSRGFTTFNDWIDRCFVEADGLQRLCKPCHRVKTLAENLQRKK